MGLLLPMYHAKGLVGFQARAFPQRDPKYVTYLSDDFKKLWPRPAYDPILGGKDMVIVEDYISAVKVSLAGYNALCLYGSNLGSVDHVKAGRVVIWLDNDNRQIKLKQHAIRERILQFNSNCDTIRLTDAKDYTIDQIRDILNGNNS